MDIEDLKPSEFPGLEIETLGTPRIKSPLASRLDFTDDDNRVMVYSQADKMKACRGDFNKLPMLEKAGPRRKIFFDPAKLNCGIVTCGGLCPGINDVIKSIVLSLLWQYGVNKVYGFRYGYAGMVAKPFKEPYIMTPETVDEINQRGGSILSSSRGPQDPEEIVNGLVKRKISLLFTIGGDGTLKGAQVLVNEIKKRKLKIGVIGIPKTIDNDISGIEQTFGFGTAVEASRAAILSAHNEAKGTWNGVGLVKLMGRHSGFISAHATLANSDVNFCYIPEVPLKLDGNSGFLRKLEKRLDRKHHAVIVVAEGAGQNLVNNPANKKDASGNAQLGDIGIYLKDKIGDYFRKKKKIASVKYIDPSYMIRSLPSDSQDSMFCLMLGQNAAHAGISGRTNLVVGYWNRYFTHIPIGLATMGRKQVAPSGHLWQTVLETTGQERIR